MMEANVPSVYERLRQGKKGGVGLVLKRLYDATLPPKLVHYDRLCEIVQSAATVSRRPRVLLIGSNLPPSRLPPTPAQYVQIDIQTMPYTQCRCDAERLSFLDSTFDAVIAMSVLEHTVAPAQIVAEMRRVVKPETGFIYVSVPWMFPLHHEPYDFWRFSSYGLRVLCRDLTIIEEGSDGGAWATFSLLGSYALARTLAGRSKAMFHAGLWIGKWLFFPAMFLGWLSSRLGKSAGGQDPMVYVICRKSGGSS